MLNNSLADNSSLENGRPEPNITALLPILIFLIIYLAGVSTFSNTKT